MLLDTTEFTISTSFKGSLARLVIEIAHRNAQPNSSLSQRHEHFGRKEMQLPDSTDTARFSIPGQYMFIPAIIGRLKATLAGQTSPSAEEASLLDTGRKYVPHH